MNLKTLLDSLEGQFDLVLPLFEGNDLVAAMVNEKRKEILSLIKDRERHIISLVIEEIDKLKYRDAGQIYKQKHNASLCELQESLQSLLK